MVWSFEHLVELKEGDQPCFTTIWSWVEGWQRASNAPWMFSNGKKLASETSGSIVTLPVRMRSSAIRQSSGRVPNDAWSPTSRASSPEARVPSAPR